MGRLYVGIDLAMTTHQVAVADEQQRLVCPPFEMGRGRSGCDFILKRVKALGAEVLSDVSVTIEATGSYWNELVWELRERGCTVYLAHPKKAHDLRRFYALHTKTDVTDAEALARMPMVDQDLHPVWVPTAEQQTLLRLCRLRWKYRCRIADVKRRLSRLADMIVPGIGSVLPMRYSRTSRVFLRRYVAPERAKKIGKKRLGQILSKAAYGKLSEEKLDRLWQCVLNAPSLGLLTSELLLEVGLQLDELEHLEHNVDQLDHRITELYADVDPDQSLLEIEGVGPFLAAALTASIGDVRRFPSSKALISYAGLAPRVHRTGGHTKGGQGITKHGSPFLRAWAFLAAANARQRDPELQAYFRRLTRRGKHYNLAMCATAARLLERAYAMLSEEVRATRESPDHLVSTG
jgi:transposase